MTHDNVVDGHGSAAACHAVGNAQLHGAFGDFIGKGASGTAFFVHYGQFGHDNPFVIHKGADADAVGVGD